MKYILHVVSCLELGGTEAFIMNMYRHIDRSRIQFDFLVLDEREYPYTEEIRKLGGEIFFGVRPHIKKLNRFVDSCVCVMKQKKYFAVHSHINNMNAWVMLSAKIANISKRISHSHDTHGKEGDFLHRKFHALETFLIKKYATEYLACSLEAGNYLYGKKLFEKKGKIINNGIDVEKFISNQKENKDLQKQLDIPTECPLIIGNISRFESKKNQLFLIDIFRNILSYEPKAILLLGGVDGGQLHLCRKKVEEFKIDENVRFIGVRKDMPDVLGLIDIYVFPSLYEGLGIVLLEAQASGCYCVASTECPTESDMKLGLIDYLSLATGAKEWAKFIIASYQSKVLTDITPETILNAFEEKKYTVSSLAKQMTEIYLERS